MKTPSQQLKLFSTNGPNLGAGEGTDEHVIDALALFDDWVMGQVPPFRRSTIKVYQALWRKFLDYQHSRALRWDDIDPSGIKRFLANLEDAKRPHRERYQTLLERMFSEIREIARKFPDNPARKEYVGVPKGQDWRDAQDNNPTQFLTPVDQLMLRERLVAVASQLHGLGLRPASRWRLARDTAIVALIYSCGIKPAEVLFLSVNCLICKNGERFIDTSAYHGLTVQERGRATQNPHADATHAYTGDEHGAARRVPIPEWADEILTQWLAIRDEAPTGAKTAPPRLFPGTRVLHPTRTATVMNPATLARVVAKWGQTYASMVLTPQRLRNAYGSTLIEAGLSSEDVGKRMGYAPGSVSAFRLRQAWFGWQELHVPQASRG